MGLRSGFRGPMEEKAALRNTRPVCVHSCTIEVGAPSAPEDPGGLVWEGLASTAPV